MSAFVPSLHAHAMTNGIKHPRWNLHCLERLASGALEMATANAKSQEIAFEGIGEKSGQSSRNATARAQEKRSEDRCDRHEKR